MRFWLASFFVLFALVEFVDWLRSVEVPFGVFVAGGVALAIASNYDKRRLFPFWPQSSAAEAVPPQSSPLQSSPPQTEAPTGLSTNLQTIAPAADTQVS